MKRIFTFCCLLFCFLLSTSIYAGDELRAGHIQLKQLSATTVEANVVLVVEGHVDISEVSLCWGDGSCSTFPVLTGVVKTAWNIKTYTITVLHSYLEVSTYTVSIDHCCFDVLAVNMTTPESSNFYIETMIVLQENQFNSTPDYFGNYVFADSAQTPLVSTGAIADPEGDSYLSELCVPVNAIGYAYPHEFFPSPPLVINPDNGGVLWQAPFFDGIYIVQTCTDEIRNGVIISSSQRVFSFMIGTEYITDVVALNQSSLSLFPNPGSEGKLFVNKNGDNAFDGADVKLINNLQQEVYHSIWEASFNQLTIPVNHLATGHYFLLVQTKNGNVFYKQIVVEN